MLCVTYAELCCVFFVSCDTKNSFVFIKQVHFVMTENKRQMVEVQIDVYKIAKSASEACIMEVKQTRVAFFA